MEWIIFNHMSEGLVFTPSGIEPEQQSGLPLEARTPLTYVNALNILLKDLSLHL